MHRRRARHIGSGAGVGALLALAAATVATCAGARAEGAATGYLSNLLSTGGYFFISDSADAALGASKFYRSAAYYDRPREFGRDGRYAWTWGFEYHSASSNFFSFSSGNDFTLVGPAVQFLGQPIGRRGLPYLSVGLYGGRVRSERLNTDDWDLVPSGAVGVQWLTLPNLTLNLHYRLAGDVRGVNPSGFGVGVRWLF